MIALLEYLPLILFFVVYKFVDIFWATGVLIVAAILQLGWALFVTKKVTTKNWVLFIIAAGLGSLTILFRDESFIQWKATIIYSALALALVISRFVFSKNLIQSMLTSLFEEQNTGKGKIDVPHSVWEKLNWFWVVILISVAIANIMVAQHFDLDTWVNFKVIGITAISFVALVITMVSIFKYLPEDEEK